MKDPAFLFYYSDFLVGTDDLTNEEVGAYIRCMCIQAAKGFITEKHMKKICNSHDTHIAVKSKFVLDEDSSGLYNSRLRDEMIKRKNYSQSRSNNRKNTNKSKTDMKNISTSYEKHMEDVNEDINEDILKGGMGEKEDFPFDEFWDLYDKKRGDKGKLSRRWDKMCRKDKAAIIDYLPQYIEATPDKQYRKDPQTFIVNRSWEDELIKAPVKEPRTVIPKFETYAERLRRESDDAKQALLDKYK